MSRLQMNLYEKGWLKVLSVLSVIIAAVFFVRPILSPSPEPLADRQVLTDLIQGKEISVPAYDAHAEFHGKKVTPPTLASLQTSLSVLGVNSEDKHIEVDLTNQRVYAFEGATKVYDFSVSTGKWAPTPTGEFRIWTKLKSTLMHGGTPGTGTYYYLPNVPWVMFFYNNEISQSRGFSLHGTYWHNNFGHPMSHGCVNMRIEDAKVLFEWVTPVITNEKAWSTNATSDNPGTKIIIYGEAPKE